MPAIKCCYKCPKRHLHCHSNCPDYIREKAIYDADMLKIRTEKQNDYNCRWRVIGAIGKQIEQKKHRYD